MAMLRKLQATPMGTQCHPALPPGALQRGPFPAPASAASSSLNMLSSGDFSLEALTKSPLVHQLETINEHLVQAGSCQTSEHRPE